MNLLSLSLASLRFRKLNAALSVLLTIMAVTTAFCIIQLSHHLETRLQKDLAHIDVVIGAKGSGLQLVLSTLMQADIPTGNIPEAMIGTMKSRADVKRVIPLALGDQYDHHRIVGTNQDYITLYNAHVAQGQSFQKNFEAVIGADVALQPGDTFEGAHGLGEKDKGEEAGQHHHGDYTVTGRLGKTGSVIDRLILTPYQSVIDIHHAEERDITALLVELKSPAQRMNFVHAINRSTETQAAIPALEILRFMNIFGLSKTMLTGFAILLLVLVGLSLWAGLSTHLQTRLFDMSLLKAMGLPLYKIAALPFIESTSITFAGIVISFSLSPVILAVLTKQIGFLKETGLDTVIFLPAHFYLVLGAFLVAVMAALPPALKTILTPPLAGLTHAG